MLSATFVDTLIDLYMQQGSSLYGGEAVTQLEHALQCAQLAEQQDGRPSLIVAALLHDVGHLLDLRDCVSVDPLLDLQHERVGFNFLAGHFGDEILLPIQYHVAAKRYLCTVDPNYYYTLSTASQSSLRIQGNRMSADEIRDFENLPHYEAILSVRRWDDAAKIPGLKTSSFLHYRPLLEACLVTSQTN